MSPRVLNQQPAALQDVSEYIRYLYEAEASFAARAFANEYDKKLQLIQQQPDLYPFLDDAKTVRVAPLPPHHRIFYRVSETEITVLRVWHSKRRLHDFLF